MSGSFVRMLQSRCGLDRTPSSPAPIGKESIRRCGDVIGRLHDLSPVISHKPQISKGGLEKEGEWYALCCGVDPEKPAKNWEVVGVPELQSFRLGLCVLALQSESPGFWAQNCLALSLRQEGAGLGYRPGAPGPCALLCSGLVEGRLVCLGE